MKIKKLNSHATYILNRMLVALSSNGQVYISAPLESLSLKLVSDIITDYKGEGKLYSLTIQPSNGTNLINKEVMLLYIKNHPKGKGLPLIYPAMRLDALGELNNESLEIRKNHVVCINTTILEEHCQLIDCWLRIYDKHTTVYKH